MSTMTLFWLVLAVALALLEIFTVQLVSIWFTVGAIAACITSIFTQNIFVQILVFAVVSAAAIAVTRPFVKKMRQKGSEPTNADRYLGKTAIVLTEINNDKASGLVKVDNEKWTARSASGEIIPQDASVTVVAIEGVKLMVEKK